MSGSGPPPSAVRGSRPDEGRGAGSDEQPHESNDTTSAAHHRGRLTELQARRDALEVRDRRLSRLRGLSALALLAAAVAAGVTDARWLWYVTAAAAALLLAFVVRHVGIVTAESEVTTRIELVKRSLDRLAGRFRSEQARGDRFVDAQHPYSADLDLFGSGSLFEQLNHTETHAAETLLASWLRAPATGSEVSARQAAARELASAVELREQIALEALRVGRGAQDMASFEAWLGGPPGLDTRRTLTVLASALVAAATLVMLALQAYEPLFTKGWLLAALAQWLLLALDRKRIAAAIGPVCSKQHPLGRFAQLIAVLESARPEDPTLRRLVGTLTDTRNGERASAAMARLEARIGWASARHNVIGLVLLDSLLGWDAMCAFALDRWRARHGSRVAGWLAAVAELEALCSIGAYAHDHPELAWPVVVTTGGRSEGGARADGPDGAGARADDHDEPEARVEPSTPHPPPAFFDAKELAHPLLATRGAVANDVELSAGPGGVAGLMVTGSNMSGKSTLLRSIGVGAVMAQAGFPVSARSLRMSRLDVRPSMRVADSLDEGVSRFYREVEKLASIVARARSGASAAPSPETAGAGRRAVAGAAHAQDADERVPVLFLLDEVLHGTNSRERVAGASAVVVELLGLGAIGAVSSHDLGLVRLEEATDGRIRNAHFEDHIAEGAMCFDYRLREGPVATSNALRLMRALGLDLDYQDEPAARS